tara:strand:+ start:399 stop:695 length:297 start_codon:yes stop_codon:yes gene_type:complete
MVKSEIISKLSKKIHPSLNKSDINKILQILLNTIIDGIKENKNIVLRDFGKFSKKKTRERIARNPKTGQKIFVSEKNSITFKMSKKLKEKINSEGKIN